MYDKQKILIVMHSMQIGGAERALLGMLSAFDLDKYQVDLFLLEHQGDLLKYIPAGIRLLPEISKYSYFTRPLLTTLMHFQLKMAYVKLRARYETKLSARRSANGKAADATVYAQRAALRYLPLIAPDTEYDLAISYRTPHYLVIDKVRAKHTMAWIHTDYSTVTIDVPVETHMWSRYEYIASISEECTKSFLSVFPELKEKIVLFDHIIPPQLIRSMAEEFQPTEISKEEGIIKICSIGRFVPAKNFVRVPSICSYLLKEGLNVKWYLIGYGGEEQAIRDSIATHKVEDHVIILGKKENPYPYIKACDIYAQPSVFEGCSVAVLEAQILNRPVVITNYPTAKSQLKDGINGFILPLETETFSSEFAKLLKDQNKIRSVLDINNCSTVGEYSQMKLFDRITQGATHDN